MIQDILSCCKHLGSFWWCKSWQKVMHFKGLNFFLIGLFPFCWNLSGWIIPCKTLHKIHTPSLTKLPRCFRLTTNDRLWPFMKPILNPAISTVVKVSSLLYWKIFLITRLIVLFTETHPPLFFLVFICKEFQTLSAHHQACNTINYNCRSFLVNAARGCGHMGLLVGSVWEVESRFFSCFFMTIAAGM